MKSYLKGYLNCKTFTLSALALLMSHNSVAQIVNGDFEQWNGNVPAGWQVIDSGISLAPSSTQVKSGGLAAEVLVSTSTQSNTDLLQTVHVEQGKSYDFSVSVFHTEGNLKARLIADGYQGYSDNLKPQQWQDISFNYTAATTKDIQVGLRFYDVSGFDGTEVVYVDHFRPTDSTAIPQPPTDPVEPPTDPVDPPAGTEDLEAYYQAAEGKTGFALKTALHNIIRQHNSQGYTAIWELVKQADLDNYYEKDGSILDMYSENPSDSDAVTFTKVTNQCGQYSKEGDCYNREHSFPKSWFGGKVEPMNSDGHHLFATDGYVNAKRSNWPFGEVGSVTYTSSNGSKLGQAKAALGFNGTVFEPVDEFKGDFARAYFYIATRYENEIASWEGNTTNSDAVLDGTNTTVFEPWLLAMLKRWHTNDPVSPKELDRNQSVYEFQGNRNPFVDHPEFVTAIWGN